MTNRHPQAGEHHRLLAQLLDKHTTTRLTTLYQGRTGLRGLHCLEIGAGCGSIANWLAEYVGRYGTVTATDPHPEGILTGHPNLTILRHSIGVDPLPEEQYDLIHARLVLQHLPDREHRLADLVTHLTPGGRILLGDWHQPGHAMILHAADPHIGTLIQHIQDTLSMIFTRAGSDRQWAYHAPAVLHNLGLRDVDTQVVAESWPAGSAGACFIAGTIEQLQDQLHTAGITPQDIAKAQQALFTPTDGLLLRGHLFYTTTATAT